MSYPIEKLGNYVDILSGFAFKSKDFSDNGIPVIKIKNINPPFVTLEDLSYVSQEIAEKQKRFQLCYDDVLIALTGSHINQPASVVGRVARVKYREKTLLNQRVGKLLVLDNDGCDLDYIYYFLSQHKIKIQLASVAGGAANQANISPSDIKELNIPFPPIEIQKRIANILKTYDDLIENNQKQIKLLEEAAQRLYKEWFVDLRFPGYEEARIVDGLPEGWKIDSIESRIELLNGYAFKNNMFNESGRYKIVTIKNVKNASFDGNNVSKIIDIPSKMPEHCRLTDGDILLTLTGNVGRVCLVYGENYLLNQRVAKLQSMYPAFTYCLFRSKNMYDAMNNLANGVAQQNLSPVRTGKLRVLFARNDLIEQFETITTPIISMIQSLNKQKETAVQARDHLLPKLMRGDTNA